MEGINEEFAKVKAEEGNHKSDNSIEGGNVVENVVENVVVNLSAAAKTLLNGYSRKKTDVAIKLIGMIAENDMITIAEMAKKTDITDRTVQRYLKEF